ncbi:unnamed protein product [Protopolystoma xenopodis]|uniref:Uncharacterized protein n=1 Tax=Protopolystoma xenopodis TaxID=117903 RepID=A0A3S5AI68_9PLAT|nr:unnamed protein product [Protopolystoma xenopodis]
MARFVERSGDLATFSTSHYGDTGHGTSLKVDIENSLNFLASAITCPNSISSVAFPVVGFSSSSSSSSITSSCYCCSSRCYKCSAQASGSFGSVSSDSASAPANAVHSPNTTRLYSRYFGSEAEPICCELEQTKQDDESRYQLLNASSCRNNSPSRLDLNLVVAPDNCGITPTAPSNSSVGGEESCASSTTPADAQSLASASTLVSGAGEGISASGSGGAGTSLISPYGSAATSAISTCLSVASGPGSGNYLQSGQTEPPPLPPRQMKIKSPASDGEFCRSLLSYNSNNFH